MFADYPVTTFVRRWFCACGDGCKGEMLYTGLSRYKDGSVTGITNQHSCAICRRMDWDAYVYPRIMHKDADGTIFS